jgi:hypothetical protein
MEGFSDGISDGLELGNKDRLGSADGIDDGIPEGCFVMDLE